MELQAPTDGQTVMPSFTSDTYGSDVSIWNFDPKLHL